ncbi:MAG: ATP-dependent Clp protease proteolytic subunit [Clostridia bacterium]|nr:ATP-dependent Clp protease proteolytic subunit [Clostridia bacterium]
MENREKAQNEVKDGAITEERIHFLTIIGQVEGHYLLPDGQKVTKYEHMLPALAEIEERRDIDGLLLLINTVGGDVEAGLAISEMIAGMSKPTVSLVLGGGHSIGIPLAVAAKKSFIVPSATMTLHPVRINGLVIGVPQSFDNLNKMQDRIVSFICRNSRVSESALRSLMMKTDEMATDIGTLLDGAEAVEIGLIDSLGTLSDAISALKDMIEKKRS